MCNILESAVINSASSMWSLPVVTVTNKDGRPPFCVDYRALNHKMKTDRSKLPKIEEIFDNIKDSSIFTTLDLFAEY